MAGTGAGEVFRGVYEGSITGSHMEVERRPYHRNCSCALHGSRGGASMCPHHKATKISYPIRRSWSEGSLALYANAASSSSHDPSPSSSPALDLSPNATVKIPHHHHHHQQQQLHHHSSLNVFHQENLSGDYLFPCKM